MHPGARRTACGGVQPARHAGIAEVDGRRGGRVQRAAVRDVRRASSLALRSAYVASICAKPTATCPAQVAGLGVNDARRAHRSVDGQVGVQRPLSSRGGSRSVSGGRPSRCIASGRPPRGRGAAPPPAPRDARRGQRQLQTRLQASSGRPLRVTRARASHARDRSRARCARRWGKPPAGRARDVDGDRPLRIRARGRHLDVEDSVPPTRSGRPAARASTARGSRSTLPESRTACASAPRRRVAGAEVAQRQRRRDVDARAGRRGAGRWRRSVRALAADGRARGRRWRGRRRQLRRGGRDRQCGRCAGSVRRTDSRARPFTAAAGCPSPWCARRPCRVSSRGRLGDRGRQAREIVSATSTSRRTGALPPRGGRLAREVEAGGDRSRQPARAQLAARAAAVDLRRQLERQVAVAADAAAGERRLGDDARRARRRRRRAGRRPRRRSRRGPATPAPARAAAGRDRAADLDARARCASAQAHVGRQALASAPSSKPDSCASPRQPRAGRTASRSPPDSGSTARRWSIARPRCRAAAESTRSGCGAAIAACACSRSPAARTDTAMNAVAVAERGGRRAHSTSSASGAPRSGINAAAASCRTCVSRRAAPGSAPSRAATAPPRVPPPTTSSRPLPAIAAGGAEVVAPQPARRGGEIGRLDHARAADRVAVDAAVRGQPGAAQATRRPHVPAPAAGSNAARASTRPPRIVTAASAVSRLPAMASAARTPRSAT